MGNDAEQRVHGPIILISARTDKNHEKENLSQDR
jgi:hypothetical protein